MPRNLRVALGIIGLVLGVGGAQPGAERLGSPQTPEVRSGAAERIAANDNRRAAGGVSDGQLTIRLEARLGEWFPDGDTDPGVVVKAFAVEGGPLQNPGPLIRVTEGTAVLAIVRNRLTEPLAIHGLYTRPGRADDGSRVLVLAPGATEEVTFPAGAPGTYFYWGATTADATVNNRAPADTQLTGAIVVDPRGTPPAPDRILLIERWMNGAGQNSPDLRGRWVINGRSWPNTERLHYTVGDRVRLRLINAGAGVHPMHLHGFYFDVDSRGDERAQIDYPPDHSQMVVTERITPGSTFSLTWTPTRPGNWLFHCHDNVHLDHGGPLNTTGPVTPDPQHHVENHALEMMAGPVMGLIVGGPSAEGPEPTGGRRQLKLVARVDAGGTPEEPAYGYTLDTGGPPPPGPYLPGPTIVLKQGEPVSITVANELPEPTTVHWHGMELESYFDGVAGFSGEGQHITPSIAPGGSFDARFTPRRSGTFIYHTHFSDTRQQRAGLAGPLLVVDSLDTYDPEHDIAMIITVPRQSADNAKVLINGSMAPAPRVFKVGEQYRLRFINVHIFRPNMRMRLLRGNTLLTWQAAAKDGMTLPREQRLVGPSEVQMGNGETYDFLFSPSEAGDLRIDVTTGGGGLLATLPITVR
jgi:FtsP/CotA-like multicopper oxidase with cupredoxin domain